MWVLLKENEKKKITKIKRRGKRQKEREVERQREGEQKNKMGFYFFSDLRKSDCRISSGKERKVFYATRATRGVPKTQDFTENLGKNLEKSKFLVFFRFTPF